MALVFIAHSKQIASWGGDVGIGKNLFLLAATEDADAAAAFLSGKPCGADDWVILKKQEAEDADSVALQDKLAAREKRVDPNLYPRLRGFGGLFKVKPENVENHLMIKKALDGDHDTSVKVKNPEMAAYLLQTALK